MRKDLMETTTDTMRDRKREAFRASFTDDDTFKARILAIAAELAEGDR